MGLNIREIIAMAWEAPQQLMSQCIDTEPILTVLLAVLLTLSEEDKVYLPAKDNRLWILLLFLLLMHFLITQESEWNYVLNFNMDKNCNKTEF